MRKYRKRLLYSVWDAKTDELLALDMTGQECADTLGIELNSFHHAAMRARRGELRKWVIEQHIPKYPEKERKPNGRPRHNGLSEANLRVIRTFAKEPDISATAKASFVCPAAVHYHLSKLREFEGLDWRDPRELKELRKRYSGTVFK